MRKRIVAAVIASAIGVAHAEGEKVLFAVTVKKEGVVTASPSFLAAVGQPASVKIGDSLSVEGWTKPPEADGRAWTQVRITYFDTGDSKFVQEMSMRHTLAEGGSFEYTDPNKRRYVIVVKEAK